VFFGCIQAVADGQALWIGRQVCIRLRAIIIGEIYAKALKRNSVAKSDKILGARDESSARRGWFKKLFGIKKDEDAEPDKQGDDDAKKDDGSQVSSGTIINLMSVDSFKVSEICAYLHYVVASIPIQFFGTIYLLYRVLGYSSFVGLAVVLAFFPLNIWISNKFTRMQKDILAATDARVDTTNEVLSNIRVIKFFAWEERFIKKVGEKREREIHFLWMRYLVWSLAALLWSGEWMTS
jgi:ABC-type multidrug transport system fused ATPase/permease subunit